ncbi:MAG: glutathione S-transferase family protein [Nevskia sp.]
MKLVIGNKNYSSWSLRPWLLLRVAEIPFEEILIPLYQPDSKTRQLAYSPAGKVPILIDDGLTVWDSLAIAEYLAEKFPARGLWPADAASRAQARCVSAEMHAGFAALRTSMPMNCRAAHPGCGHTPEALDDAARIAAIWSRCRAAQAGAGPFLFGGFTIADAMFAPVVTRFLTYGVVLPEVCTDYIATIRALPAMQDWYAAAALEPERIAASELYAAP